jgi:hypothetical protein
MNDDTEWEDGVDEYLPNIPQRYDDSDWDN